MCVCARERACVCGRRGGGGVRQRIAIDNARLPHWAREARAHLHPGPVSLQGGEVRPRPIAGEHVRLNIPRPHFEVRQHGAVELNEHEQVFVLPKEDVRFNQVLECRVDEASDTGVDLRPRAASHVDVRAEKADWRAPREERAERTPRGGLEGRLPRPPRERAELEQKRPRA